jgi:hypothetical protein
MYLADFNLVGIDCVEATTYSQHGQKLLQYMRLHERSPRKGTKERIFD